MKVLLVNDSSHEKGCTYTALKEVERSLIEDGIETEILFIPNVPVSDCIACGYCAKEHKCVIDDIANVIAEKAKTCDGFVFGSPVYYAHPTAKLLSVMDRAFYSGGRNFRFKPATAVLSARRAGQVASMDVLNKYFSINSMPIITATYWNHVYGAKAEEVPEDKEGVETMYNLGKNMAWLLKCIDCAKNNNIQPPHLKKLLTNFTRQN